ncbi:unnamed protein product [Cunninghamella echinulata]
MLCIYEQGGYSIVCRQLKIELEKYILSDQDDMDILCLEINHFFNLAYLIIEPLRQLDYFKSNKVHMDISFLQALFKFLTHLQECHFDIIPIRKVLLLAWKCMIITFGGSDVMAQSKEYIKNQTSHFNSNTSAKSSVVDLYTFLDTITEKYPAYDTTSVLSQHSLPSQLVVAANHSTVNAMGLSIATSNMDLPYQTFNQSITNVPSLYQKKKSSYQQHHSDIPLDDSIENKEEKDDDDDECSFALPLTKNGPSVPYSVTEAGNIYLSNLHISRAKHQVIEQREMTINKWQHCQQEKELDQENNTHSILTTKNKDIGHGDDDTLKATMAILDTFEEFYKSMVPHLQNLVSILLKLLLSIIPVSKSYKGNQYINDDLDVEDVDKKRENEIISKSISAILIGILKWSKLSHVLKFEYISQLLVDSGCILLIMKIMGLQDMAGLVASQTDIANFSLYKKKVEVKEQESSLYTNERNMFWVINLLRVLQKITKGKSQRINLMVQYKSSAIFRKILKISHPVMELYTLKLLKSQVAYQTKKWRSNNMKIISAIYLRCKTTLNDDWMYKPNLEEDLINGKDEEINLRLLTQLYHGEQYLPELIPPFDDEYYKNAYDQIPINGHDIDEGFDSDDFELDPTFVTTYEICIDDDEDFNANKKNAISFDTQVIDCESLSIEGDDNNNNNESPLEPSSSSSPCINTSITTTTITTTTTTTDDNDDDDNDNCSTLTTTTYNDVEDEIKAIYLEELQLEFSDSGGGTDTESISNDTLYTQSEDELENTITEKLTKIEHNTLQRWFVSKECHVVS